MVTSVALALPFLPAATEPVAEPPAELIELPQDARVMLEAKGIDLTSVPPEIGVAYNRSLQLFSPAGASAIVHKFLTGYRFPSGSENKLTEKQKEAVRLRLRVLTYKEIAAKLGVSTRGAYLRVRTSLPLLEPATLQRLENIKRLLTGLPTLEEEAKILALHEQGLSMRRIAREIGRDLDSVCRVIHTVFPNKRFSTNTPDMERAKKIVAAFWENWNQQLLPGGDFIIKIARQFSVSTKTVDLALKISGVDVHNEAKKKRLLFMLEVERSMKEPFVETAKRLRVSKNTLVAYRRDVKDGVHLRWAMELARDSKVDWWWQTKDGARVNMGIRNREVLKKIWGLSPDHSLPRLERLKVLGARQKYIADERQFREKYYLPLMDVLEAA